MDQKNRWSKMLVLVAIACLAPTGCAGLGNVSGAGEVRVGVATKTYLYVQTLVDGDKTGKTASAGSSLKVDALEAPNP